MGAREGSGTGSRTVPWRLLGGFRAVSGRFQGLGAGSGFRIGFFRGSEHTSVWHCMTPTTLCVSHRRSSRPPLKRPSQPNHRLTVNRVTADRATRNPEPPGTEPLPLNRASTNRAAADSDPATEPAQTEDSAVAYFTWVYGSICHIVILDSRGLHLGNDASCPLPACLPQSSHKSFPPDVEKHVIDVEHGSVYI